MLSSFFPYRYSVSSGKAETVVLMLALIIVVLSFIQLDRTEVIKSNLNPVFAKVLMLDYYFEEVQKLRFEVYDIHGTHSIGTRDDDFLGGVECTLGQVRCSACSVLLFHLLNTFTHALNPAARCEIDDTPIDR